jgi:carbonic anhydrase/acetyltransferase-like protein (isoleucine patch superfamily)
MIRSFEGKTPKIAATAFISETAYVVGDVEIGEYSCVMPGAVIRGDLGKITIGKNVAIEDNCVIHSGKPATPPEADVTIGDAVIIGHGAVSNCRKIADFVLIGMNATLLHDVEIGDHSIIAAGALLKENTVIPPGSVVAGVPGKIKSQVGPEHDYWFTASPAVYRDLGQRYKREQLE